MVLQIVCNYFQYLKIDSAQNQHYYMYAHIFEESISKKKKFLKVRVMIKSALCG